MSRLVATISLTMILACATHGVCESGEEIAWPDVIQPKTFDELQKKWCETKRDVDHIFVLPASLFVDSRELVCDTATYKLYRVVSVDDPEDFEYYIDPPFGTGTHLGCDGKAGLKTNVVAVNCRPE
jgi:hypothetical protein